MNDGSAGAAALSAVTFDLWHTLIYLDPAAEERYFEAQVELAARFLAPPEAARESGGAPLDRRRSAFEASLAAAVASTRRGESIGPGEQLTRAAGSLGVSVSVPEYLRELADLVLHQPFRAAPGASALLRELRADGFRVGVVSNTVGEPGSALREVLRGLDLEAPVEAFVFSDEERWSKPSPEIFWEALRRLHEPARSAVHVGDTAADIEGARRAGFRGAILFTGLQSYGPTYRALHAGTMDTSPAADRTVRDLADVRREIRSLLGPPRSEPG